jgi:uncharacterized membrane protein
MDFLIQFSGRLHPLIVHLPIGILVLAFLFECLSRFPAYRNLASAVVPSLGIGAIFAVISVVTGLLLSREGGYDSSLLQWHQNMGIATAAFAIILYFLRAKAAHIFQGGKLQLMGVLLFLPLVILISVTGHLGGSMTHGEDYLFEFLTDASEPDAQAKLKTISKTDDVILYEDVIEPILNSKCYSCHSSKKRKGELRLDQVEFIMQGGKHGAILEAGVPDSSSLYSRLILPLEDEHHMPPSERLQLSSSEISLIHAWIEGGASFTRKVTDFPQAARIKTYISAVIAQLQQEPLIPVNEVSAANGEALHALKSKGVIILPVGHNTNYLSASFVNARSIADADLQLLLPIKEQLVWLNLGRTTIADEGLKVVAQLPALRQLHLDHTVISDEGIRHLTSLTELNYLNLAGTQITDKALSHLSALKKIKSIFVYQTAVTSKGVQDFLQEHHETYLDTGDYALPKLASDTIVYKRKI